MADDPPKERTSRHGVRLNEHLEHDRGLTAFQQSRYYGDLFRSRTQ
jgi:hypothetical protein